MKRIFLGCTLLACCLLAFSCTQKPSEPSSNPSSENGSSQPSSSLSSQSSSQTPSYLSSGINSEEQQKKQAFQLARKAPSDVGYEYVWDETLNNIYVPSEAYPMGDPQPGGEPIHIVPHIDSSAEIADDIWLGGDVMGERVAYIQAVERAAWDDKEYIYSNDSFTKEYTKEEMALYIIRVDKDYVLLNLTDFEREEPLEERLKNKTKGDWILEPAAYLQEHLSEFIQKQ